MRGQTVTEEAASIEEAEALAWPRATWAEGEELRNLAGTISVVESGGTQPNRLKL